jgi:hypothetical protein
LQQKCDQYWPSKGLLAIYGRFQVALVCQDVQESYTLRVLRLKLLRQEGDNKLVDDDDCPERDVLHFHYTAWPDHGTPETSGQILAFIQKSSQSSRETDGPIAVHCRYYFFLNFSDFQDFLDSSWISWIIPGYVLDNILIYLGYFLDFLDNSWICPG